MATVKLAGFEVPEIWEWSGDPADNGPGQCASCHHELMGPCVKLDGATGPEHDECAKARLRGGSVEDAWRTIALNVAAHPSRHDAPTIRATIRNLLAMTERP